MTIFERLIDAIWRAHGDAMLARPGDLRAPRLRPTASTVTNDDLPF